MIAATTLSLHSSQNSVPPMSCPPPATTVQLPTRPTVISSEHCASSLRPDCKDHLNVFNTIQALFSAFGSANPLFSTTSSLFFAKQGVGVNYASEILCQADHRSAPRFLRMRRSRTRTLTPLSRSWMSAHRCRSYWDWFLVAAVVGVSP